MKSALGFGGAPALPGDLWRRPVLGGGGGFSPAEPWTGTSRASERPQRGKLSRSHLRRLLAFGLSAAAHLAVAMAVGFQPGLHDNVVPDRVTSPRVLTVVLREPVRPQSTHPTQTAAAEAPKEPAARLPAKPSRPIPQPGDNKAPIPLIGPAEPHYFSVRELTTRPRALNDVSPDLGEALAGVPPQTAVLRLLINERGSIDRVVIEKSFLPEHVAQVVTDAFSRLEFSPGQIDSLPVKSELRIEVNLESTVEPL